MTASSRDRTAFTLVELLVVIVIISMLMALLLAGLGGFREVGRRTTCCKNLADMALASSKYNDVAGSLPGWRNPLTTTSGTVFTSWPVMLLPNMERNDVYTSWQRGNLANPYLTFFTCPSTPPDTVTQPTLAYVGSAGAGSNAVGLRGSGVILDLTATGSMAASVSLSDVATSDGTGTTLLFSEECGPRVTGTNLWNFQPASGNGVVGWSTNTPVFGIMNATVPTKIVNSGTFNLLAPSAANMPSSNHAGGACVAFCDGRSVFLRDSLKATVYAQLMSWNHAAAASTTPYSNWVGTYDVLQDGDY